MRLYTTWLNLAFLILAGCWLAVPENELWPRLQSSTVGVGLRCKADVNFPLTFNISLDYYRLTIALFFTTDDASRRHPAARKLSCSAIADTTMAPLRA